MASPSAASSSSAAYSPASAKPSPARPGRAAWSAGRSSRTPIHIHSAECITSGAPGPETKSAYPSRREPLTTQVLALSTPDPSPNTIVPASGTRREHRRGRLSCVWALARGGVRWWCKVAPSSTGTYGDGRGRRASALRSWARRCSPAAIWGRCRMPPCSNRKRDARSRRAAPKQPASATTAEPDSDAKVRQLDYEAQCYRHAEMIARNRLGRLQESVEEMVRAKPADAGAKKADPGDADWRN